MTKHTHLAFFWIAVLSSCFGADQAAAVMAQNAQPTADQQAPAAGGTADPSFIPPPTTLISEPNQTLSTIAPETKPTPPVDQPDQAIASAPVTPAPVALAPVALAPAPVTPAPAILTPPAAPKFAEREAPRPRTPTPSVESPLPQPLYEPSQAGVVILPGRTRASSEEGVANPFEIRLIAAKPVNELKIRVGGVVMGDKPTAMVNGRPFSASDRWSGFNVVQVRRDALLLERDGVFVLIPRGREITIKIPL